MLQTNLRRMVAAAPTSPEANKRMLLGSGVLETERTMLEGAPSREKNVDPPAASPVISTVPVVISELMFEKVLMGPA